MASNIPDLSDRQLFEKIWIKFADMDKLSEKMDTFVIQINDMEKRLDCCESTKLKNLWSV